MTGPVTPSHPPSTTGAIITLFVTHIHTDRLSLFCKTPTPSHTSTPSYCHLHPPSPDPAKSIRWSLPNEVLPSIKFFPLRRKWTVRREIRLKRENSGLGVVRNLIFDHILSFHYASNFSFNLNLWLNLHLNSSPPNTCYSLYMATFALPFLPTTSLLLNPLCFPSFPSLSLYIQSPYLTSSRFTLPHPLSHELSSSLSLI